MTRRRWTPPPQGAEHWPQGPTTHCVHGWVLQGRVLWGLSASSHRPGSGQVTRRCCSPPPQASEHSLQEEVYQLRQGWVPQGRRAGGWAGPGWQWKGRSGRRCRVSTHCTSRTEEPPPQLREHLLQLPACQVAQGRRWQRRAGCGRPAGAQSSSRPELQRTSLQTAPRPQVVEHSLQFPTSQLAFLAGSRSSGGPSSARLGSRVWASEALLLLAALSTAGMDNSTELGGISGLGCLGWPNGPGLRVVTQGVCPRPAGAVRRKVPGTAGVCRSHGASSAVGTVGAPGSSGLSLSWASDREAVGRKGGAPPTVGHSSWSTGLRPPCGVGSQATVPVVHHSTVSGLGKEWLVLVNKGNSGVWGSGGAGWPTASSSSETSLVHSH